MPPDPTLGGDRRALPLQFMAMDILRELLTHTDRPSELGISLTQQLRDLTGAHSVVLARCLHDFGGAGHEVVAVCPERRRERIVQADIEHLAQHTHELQQPAVWDRNCEQDIRKTLDSMAYETALASPLKIGDATAGVVLLLGLPEIRRIDAVAEILKELSPVIAIALRYSVTYRQQEALVGQRTRALAKRVRELDFLHAISRLVEEETSLEGILRGTIDLLPQALQFPQQACVRILLEDQSFQSQDFRETPWKHTCDVFARGNPVGSLEVFYLEAVPEGDGGPFLDEEQTLLAVTAERLGTIIEHKQAEEALRRSEERYAMAQRAANMGSWDWNIPAGELQWSDQIEPLFGFAPGQFGATYESFLECVHPEDRQHVIDAIDACIGEGREYSIEHRIVWPDGTVRWISEAGDVFRDEHGKVVRMAGVVQDITDRRRVEEMLRTTVEGTSAATGGEFYRSLVQHLAQVLGVRYALIGELVAPKMQKIRTLAVFNSQDIAENFEYDLVNTPCANVVGKNTCLYEKDVRKRFPEDQLLHDLGAESYLGTPLFGSSGESLGILVVLDDKPFLSEVASLARSLLEIFASRAAAEIERMQVEAQREELLTSVEAKNAELVRFVYTVSHDLQTPLITIKGFLGMLEEEALKGNTEQLKDYAARIAGATDKMAQLLRDVLELSRIGRVVSPPEDVPLGELVDEVLELLDGRIAQQNIQVEIADDLPVLCGDRFRLHQVMQNLIENAVKYMGDQPQPRIEIGNRKDGDELVCFVRDNGAGIEPRYQENIFELFSQLDQQAEGTGVGLALVQRIIELDGGRMWVESPGLGHGSTFCFTMPPKE